MSGQRSEIVDGLAAFLIEHPHAGDGDPPTERRVAFYRTLAADILGHLGLRQVGLWCPIFESHGQLEHPWPDNKVCDGSGHVPLVAVIGRHSAEQDQ